MRNIPVRLFACVAVALTSFAGWSAVEREYIWPDGKMPSLQSHQIAATTAEVKAPGYNADDYRRPYLDWFEPPAGTNKTDVCMILISGGGYINCCDVALVERWRRKLTALGITSTPRPASSSPCWPRAGTSPMTA